MKTDPVIEKIVKEFDLYFQSKELDKIGYDLNKVKSFFIQSLQSQKEALIIQFWGMIGSDEHACNMFRHMTPCPIAKDLRVKLLALKE